MKFNLAKRFDAVGLFWQDKPAERRGGQKYARPMPPIPETWWKAPTDFPNLSAADCLSVDVESYDPELDHNGPFWARGKGHICGFSVGTQDGHRWYFPVRHTIQPETNMDPLHAFSWLRDVLADPRKTIVGANLIYDVGALRSEDIRIAGELVDVQFAEALLDERAHVSLEALSQKYLGEGKVTAVLKQWCMDFYATSTDTWKTDIWRAPPCLVGPYGEGDADLPLRLAPILYENLAKEGLLDVFKMECELIKLLVEMRWAGVSVDIPKAEQLKEELTKRAEVEHKKLDAMAGFQVEINASTSLAQAFDTIGLKYPRTPSTEKCPDGKPSFTKDFLGKVNHPLAESIKEIRRLEKLNNTFIESYILGSAVGGKVYCSFHPLRGDASGTRSGRFSSGNPNLQNIPIRDPELGKLLRSCFIPDAGHEQWRKFDYSQIEYRGLVHYAVGPGADDARALYTREPRTDYHKMTQLLIQASTGQEMERTRVKNVNFGLTYGMGEALLDEQYLHLGRKGTKKFLEQYHKGVPFAKSTMDATMDEASITGVITTILGRKSRFDTWEHAGFSRDAERAPALPYAQAITKYGRIKRAYCHKALNRRLQGSAADLIKMAMLIAWKTGVFDYIGVPRLTVHDELDFSDPGGKEDGFVELKRILETAIKFRVPIIAEEERGSNWGTVKKLK